MQRSSRLLALVALGGAVALAACGGSPDLSPVASTTAVTSDSGSVTSSGNGPGGQPSPAPSPGTGTCTNDCDGTGQGPGPGAGNGYGPGPANGGGTGNGYGPGPGPSDGFCGNACTGPVGPDPADIADDPRRRAPGGVQGRVPVPERARDIRPETVPFALIVESEERHVEALQMLFTRRAAGAAASLDAAGFPTYDSMPVACAAGVAAEIADAAFYDEYLPRTDLPQDVQNVFTNLQSRLAQQPPPGLRALPVGDTMTRNAPARFHWRAFVTLT